jgi:hypothetical protein
MTSMGVSPAFTSVCISPGGLGLRRTTLRHDVHRAASQRDDDARMIMAMEW